MKGHCGAVSKPINIHERGRDRGARTDHCYCPWARPSLMNIHKVHKTGMFWFRRSGGQNAAGTELSMGGGFLQTVGHNCRGCCCFGGTVG